MDFDEAVRILNPEIAEWMKHCPGGSECTCQSREDHYKKLAREAAR